MYLELLGEQLTTIICVITLFVSTLFLISIIIKRNDIADVAWGTGIFIVALISFLSISEPSTIHYLLLVLVLLWGGRLTIRIFLRNSQKGEDPRYKKWRDEWGQWFYLRSFFQVYLLQGALMIVIAYPLVHLAIYPEAVSVGKVQIIGLAVWIVGYFFEVVGDWQLDRFLADKNNRGQLMQSGLWRYSRHPNYFGEITMWWGIWLMVSSLPLSLLALISPLVITFLITKVSGIPMLEERLASNPDFIKYKQKTSVLIPLPPKKDISA